MFCPLLFAVVPRGLSPLSKHTDHPCRHKAWFAGWYRNNWKAKGEEIGSNHLSPRPADDEGNRSSEVLGVLCVNAERSQAGVWWGNPRSIESTKGAEKEKGLPSALSCVSVGAGFGPFYRSRPINLAVKYNGFSFLIRTFMFRFISSCLYSNSWLHAQARWLSLVCPFCLCLYLCVCVCLCACACMCVCCFSICCICISSLLPPVHQYLTFLFFCLYFSFGLFKLFIWFVWSTGVVHLFYCLTVFASKINTTFTYQLSAWQNCKLELNHCSLCVHCVSGDDWWLAAVFIPCAWAAFLEFCFVDDQFL